MTGPILILLTALFLTVFAIAIIYVIGIRSKNSTVRNAARRFHRAVGNPLQMRSAGMPGTYASVVRHQGRKTGKPYETPVWAVATEDGFVIATVYGPRIDWLKNVLANGSAVIVFKGDRYRVDQPKVVPMGSARAYFPAVTQQIHRRLHVDRCLRVRRVAAKTFAA